MRFSIIVVCLNAGEKLKNTVDSILAQTCGDYEIIVEDGGSLDGSIEKLPVDARIKVFTERDKGIYDAMNKAVGHAQGDYVHFLNCGDYFHDETVLEKISRFIDEKERECVAKSDKSGRTVASRLRPLVVYGDIYNRLQDTFIASNPKIDGFACYRNVPCHQACIYERSLFSERGYDLRYKIRADYEHFLYCFYGAKANMYYAGIVVADYEGGGFSEIKENVEKSALEHKEITGKYMSRMELFRYKFILAVTLVGLRRKIANSKWGASVYNALKSKLYKNR